MLYLHKILPILLLPTGMTLLLVLLGLRRRTKALCWIGLIVLWFVSTALVGDTAMRAAEDWQVRVPIEALPSSQAMVVLSAMRVAPPGDAPLGEWSEAVDRFEAGMALFQAGKAPVLVCTGAWVPWYLGVRPEGEILAERAVLLGVPRSHILVANNWCISCRMARIASSSASNSCREGNTSSHIPHRAWRTAGCSWNSLGRLCLHGAMHAVSALRVPYHRRVPRDVPCKRFRSVRGVVTESNIEASAM